MPAWYQMPITHGYITSFQGQGTDTPHYADDIALSVDTPITMIPIGNAQSGIVTQADYAVWNGQPGGGEVFIDLENGEKEYFYHLDQINVHVGDKISAGQEVGLSGGQNVGGSHPTSPMWSSGPHVHVGLFTNYTNTPIGSIPYGPDITPYIQAIGGGNVLGTSTPQNSTPNNTNTGNNNLSVGSIDLSGILSPLTNIGNFFNNLNADLTNLQNANWGSIGIRALLIVIGVLFLVFGVTKIIS